MKKKFIKVFNQFIAFNMSLILVLYTLFGSLLVVNATDSGIGRTTSDLNVRSAPTTTNNPDGSNNIIGELDSGVLIQINDWNKVEGTGCRAGWLNITYGNLTGYVCSSYVVDAKEDAYGRPWTTPKKAIVGGARFIASSYISKGQYTSYLKKFNVNPNAYYDQFSHQYMANLAAPSSEALSSYKTYQANGLFNLPLEFDIPVFQNMADVYNRPGGNLATIDATDEVTDQNFETYLDSQGFPLSYKRILRVLHNAHPNWTFKAMQTNVDFTTAMYAEKNVSSINGGDQYYDWSSGNKVSTEAGWYLANNETVSYYLDPRNFLTEQYILQFENLQASSNYTEAVVQTVLNNTFMSDVSILDNQSYASIFVEAGNTANVSAVYLAALAKQESGVNMGSNTNGAEFVYEGVTYSGVFNFFNIGAYSSASNPSKAGLVYATGGYCTICNPGSTPNLPVVNYDTVTTLANIGAQTKGNYLVGIGPGQTAAELQAKDGNISFNTAHIGTGTIATFKDGSQYTVVVYGDITGDGVINSADLLRLRKHLLGTEPLSGAYADSSNIAVDNQINSADLLRLRQYLLGTANIEQK